MSEGRYEAMPAAQIAIKISDLNEWGCPSCGYRSGSSHISMGGTSLWSCGECRKPCLIVADDLLQAFFGSKPDGSVSLALGRRASDPPAPQGPMVQEHPRKGTPAHGAPDRRPPMENGEFFYSRGIGKDYTPGCFVCGDGSMGLHHNISGFVTCKEAGKRVVMMFRKGGVRLDYREREPDRVQVKVGACSKHLVVLQLLHEAVSKTEIIDAAMLHDLSVTALTL